VTEHYTTTGDVQLERRIHEELGRCSSILRQKLQDNLVSILLIGGYGRGEGGAKPDASGALVPKNNYDLLVVVKRRCSGAEIRELNSVLGDVTSVNTDVSVRTRRDLDRARHSMIYFDAHQASQSLWGPRAQELIREEKLYPDAAEALRTLRNRSVLLLMARHQTSASHMHRTWRSKAVIGYLDALAILKQQYVSRYSLKRNSVSDLLSNIDWSVRGIDPQTIAHLFETAIDVRTNDAHADVLMDDELLDTVLSQLHLLCFSIATGRERVDWQDIPRLQLPLKSRLHGAAAQVKALWSTKRHCGAVDWPRWDLGFGLDEASQKSLPYLLFDRSVSANQRVKGAFPALVKEGDDNRQAAARYIDIFNNIIA